MKKSLGLLLLATLASTSTNLYADRGNGMYIGLKTGVLEPDSDTLEQDIDDDKRLDPIMHTPPYNKLEVRNAQKKTLQFLY